MTNERKKILDKAKKIKELADKGIDGEMSSAKNMLKLHMTKHNISEDELSGYKSSSSIYADMTDEQFFKEMGVEFLIVMGVHLFSKFGSPELHEHTKAQVNKTTNKFLNEMNDRVNKKR